jgi:hypothetical protein
MFNLFKKKSEIDKLQDSYKKLMEEAYKLQSSSNHFIFNTQFWWFSNWKLVNG